MATSLRSLIKENKLTRGTYKTIFIRGNSIIVNGLESVITSNCWKNGSLITSLDYHGIIFYICFNFNSDQDGSLASMRMKFSNNTKISEETTIVRQLGSGSFGDVFLVCVAGKEYALKVGLDIPCGSGRISVIQNEVNMFELLGQHPPHPNLIQSFPIEFPLGPAVFLELGQETLDDKIKSGTLTFEQIMEIILQILRAVAFLHSIGISHHDLKPDNILFVGGVLKIIDFGFSYPWETEDSFRSHRSGTHGYNHRSPSRNSSQDALSCVFIFIEMFIGKNIRSRDKYDPRTIVEVSKEDIQIILKTKGISEENIQIICLIYSMRTTIELNRLIELVESIQ
jgi:serine/threonine protein kinase